MPACHVPDRKVQRIKIRIKIHTFCIRKYEDSSLNLLDLRSGTFALRRRRYILALGSEGSFESLKLY